MKSLCAATLAMLIVSPATPQRRVAGGSVTGIVLCEDSQLPAQGANILLQAPIDPKLRVLPSRGAYVATTNVDGSFTISNITPGEYYLITRYPGYIPSDEYIYPGALSREATGHTIPLPSFVQRVTIVSGSSRHVDLQLKRGGSISGSVMYSDGVPAQYVALTPKIKLSNGTFGDAVAAGAAHTDSTGHYRIDSLADASYIILAGIEGDTHVRVFGGGQIGGSGLIVFAGTGMRPSKARIISVTSPKEYAGVDIKIPLTGVHEVGGTVTASDGRRINHGLVRLYPTGEPRFNLATPLAADGTFSFHRVPADSYTVLVEDGSDWKMVPAHGVAGYEQPTLVQRYRASSIDINVGDSDITNVSLIIYPTQ
jgi:hypothetical protein